MAEDAASKIKKKRATIEEHARKSKERAEIASDIKGVYRAAKDSQLIKDLLSKLELFKDLHMGVARDGVGARKTGYKLENGQEEVENIFLTNNKRVSELDRAAGIQQVIDYIERQIADEPPKA